MSIAGDALKAIRTTLSLQDDVRRLSEMVKAQGDRLTNLGDGMADLRDRVSRLEGVIEGASMAVRQRQIEG